MHLNIVYPGRERDPVQKSRLFYWRSDAFDDLAVRCLSASAGYNVCIRFRIHELFTAVGDAQPGVQRLAHRFPAGQYRRLAVAQCLGKKQAATAFQGRAADVKKGSLGCLFRYGGSTPPVA